mmetsp:Transcript_57657/g.100922  ORF Transcript_57657/g.100922 Transcript_57657/m.100922 type:complete len:353 (+) Transcript_57657:70-1128(+)
MCTIACLLTFLACAGHGHRSSLAECREWPERMAACEASSHSADRMANLLELLSVFLLAKYPGAGWQITSAKLGVSHALVAAPAAQEPKMSVAPNVLQSQPDNFPAGLSCRLSLNIGRQPGTRMPKDWAVSGARLLLPLEVTFSDESVGPAVKQESLLGPQKGMRRLIANGEGVFVSARGEERVAVESGAWSVSPSGHPSGETLLRFYLDFPEAAVRNDVELPAGRVFFTSAFWPQEELSKAQDTVTEMETQVNEMREELNSKNLREGNALQQASALRAGFNEYDRLKTKEKAMMKFRAGLPNDGVVEVPDTMLSLEKNGGLCIKKRGPAWRAFREEFLILGTFGITSPVLSR